MPYLIDCLLNKKNKSGGKFSKKYFNKNTSWPNTSLMIFSIKKF